jgi:hypothetical protein
MALSDYFGFSFGKKKTDEMEGVEVPKTQPSFISPEDYDGTYVIETGGILSSYFDFGGSLTEENTLIQQYRSMALYPEVDKAIQDIVNDAVVFNDENEAVQMNLDNITFLSENIKSKLQTEFKYIKKLLDFNNKGDEIFRRWYIDSKLYFHVIIDLEQPQKGIIELRGIDPTKIKKIRKVEKEIKTANTGSVAVVKKIDEFFIYTDLDTDSLTPTTSQGIKIAVDSISYLHSGIVDSTTKRVVGYVHKAIRPVNMLRQIEDAIVIYRMSRAPDRRIFYVDVGNLPKQKAEQYIASLMNKYRNKITYDSRTGEIKDERNHMSMLEDYWIPRREGNRGTEVATLEGGQNLGQLEDVDYLLKKVYRALNVPISRMETTTGFSLGRSTEITRDEVLFFKFIEKLRKRFSLLFVDLLKKQVLLKGIMTESDWSKINQDIYFVWNKDSFFSDLKENEILREKVDMLNIMANYVGQFYSNEWLRKNILKQTDEEIQEINQQMQNEQAAALEQQMMQQQEQGVEGEEPPPEEQ